MLETLATAALGALICTLAAHFVLNWETRMRLRRIEEELADYDARLQTETKRRAAQRSADVRNARAGDPLEAEINRAIAATSGAKGPQPAAASDADDGAWFDSLLRHR